LDEKQPPAVVRCQISLAVVKGRFRCCNVRAGCPKLERKSPLTEKGEKRLKIINLSALEC
jgi:hypothetical protein